jgi:HEAT repeat protein
MPVAAGIVRPSVIMPADADAWSESRLRIVLLHELAHVKRRDCLTHLVAQAACAVYWFNPLAWIAAKRIRTERERACDDLVIAAGTRGSDYADQLLEIARAMQGDRFPGLLAGGSLAMAHRSQLEGRLIAILDPRVPRVAVSRLRAAAAVALCCAAVAPLGAIQPWRNTDHAVNTDSAVNAVNNDTDNDGNTDSAVNDANSAAPLVRQPAPPAALTAPAVQAGSHRTATPTPTPTPAPQHTVEPDVDVAAIHRETSALEAAAKADWTVPGIAESVGAAFAGAFQTNPNPNPEPKRVPEKGGRSQADPRMVAALTAALKDSDKEVRETAMQALVQLRDPSIFEPLTQALKDGSPDVREQAAFGLGQLRDRRAVQPLIASLKDENPGVREQVVFALGQIRDPQAVEGLALAVRDPNADVREKAVFALGQIRDRRAVEPLISALKDSDADVREQAAFALGQIRDRGAVDALAVAIKDANASVREQVAFALGQIRDPRAIDALTTALKDQVASVRRQAAFALGQLAR